MNYNQVTMYKCRHCGNLHYFKVDAESCCEKVHCSKCGKNINPNSRSECEEKLCDKCKHIEILNNTPRINCKNYDGPIFDECYNFYNNLGELEDECENEDIELPDFVYPACKQKFSLLDKDPKLFVKRYLENSFEEHTNMCEGYYFENIKDHDEFVDFVSKWLNKQEIDVYYVDERSIIYLGEDQ